MWSVGGVLLWITAGFFTMVLLSASRAARPPRDVVQERPAIAKVESAKTPPRGGRIGHWISWTGRWTGLATVLLAVSTPASASASVRTPCAAKDLRPTSANIAAVRGATLCLLNVERARHRMRALRPNLHLRTSAQRYSRAMVHMGFFNHISPSGGGVVHRVRQGTAYMHRAGNYLLGENLAWRTDDQVSARQTVADWMRSPIHRAVILDRRFHDIGIGIVIGIPYATAKVPAATYTTHFGRHIRG